MRTLSAALLFLLLPGCRRGTGTGASAEINNLYNAVNNNRYAVNDSMRFYIDAMEDKAKGAAPVYKAMAHISRGIYFSRVSIYPAALEEHRQAIRILLPLGVDSLIGRAYNGIGSAFRNMSQYPQAIEHFQKALAYFEKIGFDEGIAGVNSNIALTYQMKGDSAAARYYIQAGLAALRQNKRSRAYLNLLHLSANAYLYAGNTDSALALDAEGIKLANELQAPLLLSPFLDNAAGSYSRRNRPDSAYHYYRRSIAIDSSLGLTRQVADGYLNLGMLALTRHQQDLAVFNFKKSISLSRVAGYKQAERDAWNGLQNVYEEKGNYTAALDALKAAVRLNDSIINLATEKRIAELQAANELEKKEAQLQNQAALLNKQKTVNTVILLGSLFALLFAYSQFRRWQRKKQAEVRQALLQQKQEATINILNAEEKERQRIAVDLHDGIGQTMTAAWLNLQALGKRLSGSRQEEYELVARTTDLVGNSCGEIRQVSHNMMPNVLQRKGLLNALREFTGQLDERTISVRLQAEDVPVGLEATSELIIYRVIQECVNNVIRHADATELDISITAEVDGLDILIEDNGKGFDMEEVRVKAGLGLQNIRSRIQYLNGTVEWDNTGSGTVVAIHIPY